MHSLLLLNFCSASSITSPVFGCLLVISILFVGIAVLCDDYLVPWLQKIQRICGMSDDVAGVTLVAFGSAAPELIISTVSVLSNDTKIGVGVICGSAMIAFGLIPACCFFAVKQPITLNNFLVCRDVLSYLIGASLLMLFFFVNDGNINIWEALTLILIYIAYICVVVMPPWGNTESGEAAGEDSALLESSNEEGVDKEGDQVLKQNEEAESSSNITSVVYNFVAGIFTFIFRWTIPAPPEEDSADTECNVATVIGTLMTFFYLSALSYGAYYDVVYLCNQTPYLSQEAAGAVLLAAGAQIPDLLAAVSLTKAGMPYSAISSTISSQVIVVTLGLGLPWATYIAINGKNIDYANSDRTQATDLSLFFITTVVAAAYLGTTVSCTGPAKLTHSRVSIQLTIFVLAYVAYFVVEVLYESGYL